MSLESLASKNPPSILVAPDYPSLCRSVAERIAALVRSKPNSVLGLATESTPPGAYRLLVKWHEQEGLDFSRATCFNLDEYFPMVGNSSHSYHRFMQENLFQWINSPCWHVQNGRRRSLAEIARDCQNYEALIASSGGIDLQILGIGRTGHIGFNEPGSARNSRTRLVTLHDITRSDAAPSFGGLEFTPRSAVTMGIGTILESRKILLMASGAAKAEIISQAFQGAPTEEIPASFLQLHPGVTLYLDQEAASCIHHATE